MDSDACDLELSGRGVFAANARQYECPMDQRVRGDWGQLRYSCSGSFCNLKRNSFISVEKECLRSVLSNDNFNNNSPF